MSPSSSIAPTQQELATQVVSDFEIETSFDPPPGILSHHHVQTIGGFLLRQKGIGAYLDVNNPWAMARLFWEYLTIKPVVDQDFWDERERIDTPDGDWFHVDTKYSSTSDDDDDDDSATPTVFILHGLESNSDSMLAKEMAHVITSECNMHCTCVNFRGCTGTPNDTPGAYHLGFTDDLQLYLDRRREKNGDTTEPIYLAGFSLGANAILKCLGELGADATARYNIQGGVALCAPLDQERNARALARPGINRIVYTNMLLKTMKSKAQDQLARFCDNDPSTSLFDYPRAMAAETITEFDDAFIAPIYGYKDCWDYYRKTSSIHFVENITVPTLILNAKDDPFMDPEVAYEDTSGVVPVRMVSMPHGGHLGFALHRTSRHVSERSSWYTHEMGRFFRHVQRQQQP